MSYFKSDENINATPNQKELEENQIKFESMRRTIEREIPQSNDWKSLNSTYKKIKDLKAQFGEKNEYAAQILMKQFMKQLDSVNAQCEKESNKIFKEIEDIKNEHWEEPEDTLLSINVQADKRYYELAAQLNMAGKENKKIIISRAAKTADRPTAVALLKLMQSPQYAPYFSEMQKRTLLNKSKSSAEISWENQRQARIQEKGAQQAKYYNAGYQVRTLKKMIAQ